MRTPVLSMGLLTVGCFSLATWIGPRMDAANRRGSDSVLGSLFGNSRKVFADHFFTRSDVYFHSGYYPSIFDQAKVKENHLAGAAAQKCDHDHDGPCEHEHAEAAHEKEHGEEGHVHGEHCNHGEEEHNFLGRPKDYFDGFSRNFFVSRHTHLTDKGTNAPKEILPWIKLAAKLDPAKVESYTVGAYWLRTLNKSDEAEQFLREGLRHNPNSYEILMELGRSYFDRKDFVRSRNVLQRAIACWREQENPKPVEQQDRLAASQILNALARVEVRLENREQAIRWLEIVQKISPHPDEVKKRIAEVRAGQPFGDD